MGVREIVGKRLPFLRWSVVRMGLSKLTTTWQVGDGREAALMRFVLENARPRDLDDAIRVIDKFAYEESFLINVGDEKGALLDAAVARAKPKKLLELGTYCGYSALRTMRAAPSDARLCTVEFNADNAAIAQRIFDHAGIADRVTIIHGTLGDGGKTATALRDQHGFMEGTLDFAFLDHAKDAYLPDLLLILRERWLRPGAIIVADNIKTPGAPEYRAYMKAQEGLLFHSREHKTHAEYQTLLRDIVLESEYTGS
jgi:catechol O-methyltransferase